MGHQRKLLEYKNKELMDELNEFFITVKCNLLDVPIKRPKPTIDYMDDLMFRILEELRKDNKPIIKP